MDSNIEDFNRVEKPLFRTQGSSSCVQVREVHDAVVTDYAESDRMITEYRDKQAVLF